MALTIAALGTLAVGTVASAWSAYQQGEISRENYETIKAATKKYEESLQAPPGTAPKFTPEEYAQIQKFSPKIAQYVQEKRPEMVSEAGSQNEIRAQKEGLSDLRSRVMSGKDVISDAQQEEALYNADAQAKGRRQQIMQDLANRGMSGSGQDILAQLGSSQQAQQNARQDSLNAAKGAEERRINALGQMTNLAGQVRGQNRQTEQTNADIMNSYNQRLASGQNQYNQNVAGTQNQAQMFNIGNEAQVNQANVGLRNAYARDNGLRQFQQEQSVRDFANNKAANVLGAQTGLSNLATTNARNDVANTAGIVQGIAAGGAQIAAGMHADNQNELNRQAMTKTGSYAPKTASLYDENEDTLNKNAARTA